MKKNRSFLARKAARVLNLFQHVSSNGRHSGVAPITTNVIPTLQKRTGLHIETNSNLLISFLTNVFLKK